MRQDRPVQETRHSSHDDQVVPTSRTDIQFNPKRGRARHGRGLLRIFGDKQRVTPEWLATPGDCVVTRSTLSGIPESRDASKPGFWVFGYSLAPLYDFWEHFQVSHCGQYSVERMLALDEYCQKCRSSELCWFVCFSLSARCLSLYLLRHCHCSRRSRERWRITCFGCATLSWGRY